MKKIFFIACFVAYVHIATVSCQLQAESPIEQLVRIMILDNKPNHEDIYNLAIEHPSLLTGIIYKEQTFAMLCVKRLCGDILMRLINEDRFVDFSTPCEHEFKEAPGYRTPQTYVLNRLFLEITYMNLCRYIFRCDEFNILSDPNYDDHFASIIALTKLIINKYPYLLDLDTAYKSRTSHQEAWQNNLCYLISGY